MNIIDRKGTFVSREGHEYRITITRYVNLDEDEDGENYRWTEGAPLQVAACEIEWEQTELHDVVQGSACTLTLVSDTDRRFIDLYAEGSQRVGLVIERRHPLGSWDVYWRGTLDPEQYEEPYSAATDYEVTLVFSDFGRLGRLPYKLNDTYSTGEPERVNLWGMLARAFAGEAGMDDVTAQTELEFELPGGGFAALGAEPVAIDERALLDDDGEPLTWREAVEAVLLPLGLRVVQVAGVAVVYDIESAWYIDSHSTIQWQDTDQVLGVDHVYRAIEVNYSPGGDNTVADASVERDSLSSPQTTYTYWLHPDSKPHPPVDTAFRVRVSETAYKPGMLMGAGGFTMSASVTIPGTTATVPAGNVQSLPWYFASDRAYGGDDSSGVIAWMCDPEHTDVKSPVVGLAIPNPDHRDSAGAYDQLPTSALVSVEPRHVNVTDTVAHVLRLSVEMLFDARYNPFDSDTDDGDGEAMDKYWARVYVPCRLWLEGDDGSVWHYANNDIKEGDGFVSPLVPWLDVPGAGWVSGAGGWGRMWLCWYDWDTPGSRCGVKGWSTNRPCAGRKTSAAAPYWHKRRGDGEYIPLPPVSGTLHFEIGAGVYPAGGYGIVSGGFKGTAIKYGNNVWWNGPDNHTDNPLIIACARWHAYRSIAIEAVDEYGRVPDGDEDTLSYRADIDADAADVLSLDTRMGSVGGTPAGCVRLYYEDGGTGAPVSRLRLIGKTGIIEHWLIARLAGQYDHRRAALQGTVAPESASMTQTICEASSPQGTLYLCTGKTEYLADDETEAHFVEVTESKFYPVENATD